MKHVRPRRVWRIFRRDFEKSAVYTTSNYHNLAFITASNKYIETLLAANGWVTLNDIWDALGLSRTAEGMIYGFTKQDKVDICYINGMVIVECRLIYREIGA